MEAFHEGASSLEPELIARGDLRVYPQLERAELAGRRLRLTAKEFDLLVLFARNPGRLLRRDLISASVWKRELRGRTIDVHVARLRAHLPAGAIKTVIPLGYRFVL